MAKILCTGIATLDIINEVESYPGEDDEILILSQEKRRGGNASNTAVVLSQLGHQCSWAGTLVNEIDSQTILDNLKHYKINHKHCQILKKGKIPTSYITISRATGSRTISHFRDLPEYSFKDFKKIDLTFFDWFHFEGRNISETKKMMLWCKQQCPETPVSIEIEKPRKLIHQLIEPADLILFSRQFAQSQGATSAKSFCHAISSEYSNKTIVCAWGDAGAGGIKNQAYYWQAALKIKAIDTLAAGDVFNAGYIHQKLQKQTFKQCITYASQLAGMKCTHKGIDNLITDYVKFKQKST